MNAFFFIEIPNLGRQFWQINFGAFEVLFIQFISTLFGTVSPLSIFSINQLLFLQKTKPLYPNPKYLLYYKKELNVP